MFQASQLENIRWWENVELIYEEPSKDKNVPSEPKSDEALNTESSMSNTAMQNYYFED